MSGGDLALSRPLLAWLRRDPTWTQLPRTQRARLAWQAGWGSLNARLSTAAAAAEGPPLRDPLLIVGPWRSGTTVMHELLVAATGLPTPQTWQCMNACAFQLGRAPRTGLALARPMDGLEIRADSPQEDEFALLTLGVASAYRAFWMPHRIGELLPTLQPQYWLEEPGWLPTWEAFLRGVLRSLGTVEGDQPLILKSPNHSFRLPAILRRFPRAGVVWMARPAAEVFQSNLKMWQAMFAQHGLTEVDQAKLEQFLAQALQISAAVLEDCVGGLPRTQWCAVSQQALQHDGERIAMQLAARFAPQRPLQPEALRLALQTTGRGRIDRATRGPWRGEIATAIAALDAAQAAAIAASPI